MARKPNFDFERREREKAKAARVAERVKSKTEKAEPKASDDKPDHHLTASGFIKTPPDDPETAN